MIKIIVDCFGGDKSPGANVDGALLALEKYPELHVTLTGDEAKIAECLGGKKYDTSRLEIVHAPDVINVSDKPTDAIRLKKESSMMKGVYMLIGESDYDGLVTTGSTGAIVAAGMLKVGRLKNVIRPTFCPILPTLDGGIVGVSDTGANVDITPDHLLQYAIMGSLYLKNVYGIENPRVALLNIGVEAEKGDALRKEAYKLLEESDKINFVGNMESRDLLSGKYDLVVCDGFSGNVLVKTTEGTALLLLKKLKKDIMKRTLYKLGALLMKKMFDEEKRFMNYQNYGGSVLLGTKKIIVKGHGSSDATAVYKCIEQAYLTEASSMNGQIEENLPIYDKRKA